GYYEQQGSLAQQMMIMAQELGLSQYYNKPLYIQYLAYLKDLIRLDFGVSLSYFPVPVSRILLNVLPWTLLLIYPSIIASFFIGNILGRYAALGRGKPRDYAVLGITMFLYTFPLFVLGEILIEYLAIDLKLFPIGSAYNTAVFPKPELTWPFITNVLYHAALPWTVLILFNLAGWAMGMRNNMIPLLQEDFMNYYRLMGVPEGIVSQRAYRVAILPNFTSFAISMGYAIIGTTAIEILFNYGGVGYFWSLALSALDYPLLNGIFFIFITILVISNFIADMVYGIIDPRTSHEETEGL
ncbi:MAG: ABC transporter permease, partial [Sulfolobus sp.]|nr:ABC transporter permease [Sulfolobus sp.]